MPKVGFVSLGCPKNLVDTEVMMGLLARDGHEITPRADEAEILVVNTCSFIDPARKESIDAILEMAELKKFGTARKLVVAGCLVERHRDEIQKQIPEVDAVVGINEVERIVDVCRGDVCRGDVCRGDVCRGEAALPVAEAYLYHDATPRILATPRHYAYIKITEGCDHPCSFCIIPQLRGHFRSRRFESVVSEAQRLFRQGVREINLIGQDTTWYGEDLGLKDGLPLLLERLAQLPEAGWIRFLYCYPNRVTQRLLDTIAQHPALAKYLDIPLQHASRAVLRRMRRGQSGDQFLKLIDRARRTIPDVGLRTSMIVGFPGETEAQFEELCAFVEAAQFDNLGVFAYSDQEIAASSQLEGKLDGRTIERRRRRLMAVQRKIARRKNKEMIGRTVDVLLEGASQESELLWAGRMQTQAPEIDGRVLINDAGDEGAQGAANKSDRLVAGDFVRVEVTGALDYDLLGRIVEVGARFIAPKSEGAINCAPTVQISNAMSHLQEAR